MVLLDKAKYSLRFFVHWMKFISMCLQFFCFNCSWGSRFARIRASQGRWTDHLMIVMALRQPANSAKRTRGIWNRKPNTK